MLETTSNYDEMSKSRCRDMKVRNTLRQAKYIPALRQNEKGGQGGKCPWLVSPSDFWQLMSYHKFGYAGDALRRNDRTLLAHWRCIPGAVLRTPFKERTMGWEQRGEPGKWRVEAEHTSTVTSGQVHLQDSAWILFYELLHGYCEMCFSLI